MGLFKQFILTSSTEINSTPENIWDFLYKIEDNYMNWHPKEHKYFHWTKGSPFKVGSKFDSEEIVDGHIIKIKEIFVESLKNRKIALKPSWPISFMCPKIEWIIEVQENVTVFTAQTYYKFGKLFLMFKKIALKI